MTNMRTLTPEEEAIVTAFRARDEIHEAVALCRQAMARIGTEMPFTLAHARIHRARTTLSHVEAALDAIAAKAGGDK